jgi:hypothetical protein
MALPDFSKFKAPYRFVGEGRAFRLYEKGVKTNTTFKTMAEAKKKVLALNDAWRASPAGRKATPKKKYDGQGHVVRKPARRARTNPFFGLFGKTESGPKYRVVEYYTSINNVTTPREEEVAETDLRDHLLDLEVREREVDGFLAAVKAAGKGSIRARGGYGDVIEVVRIASNPRRVGMFSTIQPGDRVTIVTPRGQEMTGRAVMKGPAGWVLNMGGRYGTPALADEDNVIKVSKSRRAA